MDKQYISAGDLLQDSFRLAAEIHASGFRPDLLIGVWRGGTPVAIAVQEFLEFKGLETDHMPLRISSYVGIDHRAADMRIEGLEAVLERVGPGSGLLLVDDVFDTGRSAQAVHDALLGKLDPQAGGTFRIACPWYKPARRSVAVKPDYFLHETDRWLVFPHEILGLTEDEIRTGKGAMAKIILAGKT